MRRAGRTRPGLLPALAVVVALTGCTPDAERDEPAPPGPTGSTSGAPPGPDPGPDPGPAARLSPVTLAFAGDVHFEGDVADLLDEPGSTLGRMSGALRSADVAVVNLESALTTGGSRARKELEDPAQRYWFRSPPAALDLLERSGVDAVSMANNHGADFGAAGLRDTLRAARGADVAVLGVGADITQALRPYETTVDGTRVAVLAADASPLESRSSIWDVAKGGPGVVRAGSRLVSAVRDADRENDVVAVYLHWGAENTACPTDGQLSLAQDLADAGADVVVGSHAHQPQGAGMLGSTYVAYGLGNFLWYHGNQSDTGVLRLEVADGGVVGEEWVPGEIGEDGGPPRPLGGGARDRAVEDWEDLRGCTGLAPGPGSVAEAEGSGDGASTALPAYASSIRTLPAAVRTRMREASHRSERCPVELADLRLLELTHLGFDGRARTGQLVVHRDHARDLVVAFGELYRERFPIERMQLVDDYGGDDDRSMAANNSSAYNCRTVAGSSGYSRHAYGAAVDVNPVQNPYVTPGDVAPEAGRRFLEVDRAGSEDLPPGVVADGDVVVRAFAKVGWSWGGTWADPDYQHFFTG
ncbi:poly-gamma-glutamate synthesis protein (capsule biosynthesis protein) [Microlunatus sagamiharensis]|uniref:Poly-gamma-glutamate synthesis protein (Capsule biosynthesis protein) n=1 Tax=Microlunatus sagamiharensis TaxID=546874 RepID=A0A1H2M2S5_9ACTN|nr:CapA family protein [Microlunatus sagamiharensis]SDU87238.1 poly-gamma-glutamate synthesis protein (capsule biosynthesis protein) [Microlunatus sagamiharensis]